MWTIIFILFMLKWIDNIMEDKRRKRRIRQIISTMGVVEAYYFALEGYPGV